MPSRKLRLLYVMRLRGASPVRRDADLERAARQCAGCHYTQLCDELLACGAHEGYSRFCPNAPYIEQVRGRSLSF